MVFQVPSRSNHSMNSKLWLSKERGIFVILALKYEREDISGEIIFTILG